MNFNINYMYQPKYFVEVLDNENDVIELFSGDNRGEVIKDSLQYLYSHKNASYFKFYKL